MTVKRKKETARKAAKKGDRKWIQNAIKRPGAFTKKAKAAGKSVSEYAEEILEGKKRVSTRTRRQAALARTLKKISRKRTRRRKKGS